MMKQTDSVKWMTIGEGGLTVIFAVAVFLSIIAAAKAEDTAYAFHVTLAGFASLASIFVILNRYFERGALPPQEIDGRPNYNFGPIKFAAAASVFWGIAGFTVGLLIAMQLA